MLRSTYDTLTLSQRGPTFLPSVALGLTSLLQVGAAFIEEVGIEAIAIPCIDSIVGGTDVPAATKYCFIASLQRNSHSCDATILALRLVVTAVHCASGVSVESLKLRVWLSQTRRRRNLSSFNLQHGDPSTIQLCDI